MAAIPPTPRRLPQDRVAKLIGMKTPLLVALLCLTWPGCLRAQSFSIGFDQTDYTTEAGQALVVSVKFASPPAAGLFSYGLKLTHEPDPFLVPSTSAILVPAALDFNGAAGAGATKAIDPGFAGVKGTVDLFAAPIQYYPGSPLASFELHYQTPGHYNLGLEIFRTLGPSESIFVDGNGAVLDNNLSFSTAKVEVVPEPSVLAFFGWAATGLLGVMFARRSRKGEIRERNRS